MDRARPVRRPIREVVKDALKAVGLGLMVEGPGAKAQVLLSQAASFRMNQQVVQWPRSVVRWP